MSQHLDPEQARWEALIDREAIGESLDPSERELVDRYEAAHPELAHERAIFEAAIAGLREQLDAEEDELTIARQTAASLERYRSARDRAEGEPINESRRSLLLAAAAVAVAAGLALWVGLRQLDEDEQPKLGTNGIGEHLEHPQAPERTQPQPQPQPQPSTIVPVDSIDSIDSTGRLSMVASGASIDVGATLEPGASLSIERACVSWTAPTAVVCFEGELRSVVGSDAGERRLRLESGRLVAALDPLGPGQRFTIETAAGSASAIGTVFAVELDEGRTWVTVLEGRVELRDPEARMLEAGQRSSLPGEIVALDPDAIPTALLELAERLRTDPDEARAIDPHAAPANDESSDAGKTASAKQLAEAAQRERAAKNYEETARLYRELLRRYPESREAANVPVRLGDLLASTGDHQGALEAYELYLERGGKPLAPEAEYGRVRALRALNRTAEERAAIEAFLAARPDDYRCDELQARLGELP